MNDTFDLARKRGFPDVAPRRSAAAEAEAGTLPKIPAHYGSLGKHFVFYGAYHSNAINQMIHIIWFVARGRLF